MVRLKLSLLLWPSRNSLRSLTYLLTPWSRVLLEKLNGSAASQEIPRIFGTRKFLTVFTSARHLSLSCANSIQSPQPPSTSWRYILILSSHLRMGLPNVFYPSGFHTRTLCAPLHSLRSLHWKCVGAQKNNQGNKLKISQHTGQQRFTDNFSLI